MPSYLAGVGEGWANAFGPVEQELVKNSALRPSSSFRGRPQPPLCNLLSPEAVPRLPGLKQLLSPRLASSSGLRLTFSSVESGLGSNQEFLNGSYLNLQTINSYGTRHLLRRQ